MLKKGEKLFENTKKKIINDYTIQEIRKREKKVPSTNPITTGQPVCLF